MLVTLRDVFHGSQRGCGFAAGTSGGFRPSRAVGIYRYAISSDGDMLVVRKLDDTLGLPRLASAALRDNRTGKNIVYRNDGLFRQSVYGVLAGYEDVNNPDRLALGSVIHEAVGGPCCRCESGNGCADGSVRDRDAGFG